MRLKEKRIDSDNICASSYLFIYNWELNYFICWNCNDFRGFSFIKRTTNKCWKIEHVIACLEVWKEQKQKIAHFYLCVAWKEAQRNCIQNVKHIRFNGNKPNGLGFQQRFLIKIHLVVVFLLGVCVWFSVCRFLSISILILIQKELV